MKPNCKNDLKTTPPGSNFLLSNKWSGALIFTSTFIYSLQEHFTSSSYLHNSAATQQVSFTPIQVELQSFTFMNLLRGEKKHNCIIWAIRERLLCIIQWRVWARAANSVWKCSSRAVADELTYHIRALLFGGANLQSGKQVKHLKRECGWV